MEESRKSAEHFLDLIKKSRRGKFKIYIGMSAGVGKTYRMLQEAHTLLTNAIRYSHDNSSITIRAEETVAKVKISVIDTGQGIAPEYLGRVFDRYFRVPGIKKDGTGLGLSISKEFIEAQGGTISANSELGSGSTFTVELNKVS